MKETTPNLRNFRFNNVRRMARNHVHTFLILVVLKHRQEGHCDYLKPEPYTLALNQKQQTKRFIFKLSSRPLKSESDHARIRTCCRRDQGLSTGKPHARIRPTPSPTHESYKILWKDRYCKMSDVSKPLSGPMILANLTYMPELGASWPQGLYSTFAGRQRRTPMDVLNP